MVEPDERDRPAAALQIVLGREDAGYFRGLLHEGVPLGAVRALALPAGAHRPAGLAYVTCLGLRHVKRGLANRGKLS